MKFWATAVVCAVGAMTMIAAQAEAGRNSGARVVLHTVQYSKTSNSCSGLRSAFIGCDTASPTADPAWTDVLVGFYANQLAGNDPDPGIGGDPGLHLTGADFGIQYDDSQYTVSWTKCGDLEVATDGVNPEGNPFPAWPLNGSGDTVVWVEPQRGETVIIGYFHVLTYGVPGTFSIIDHPGFPLRLLDDAGQFDDVPFGATAGFGGTLGGNTCPVGVKPTTWGSIKSLFNH